MRSIKTILLAALLACSFGLAGCQSNLPAQMGSLQASSAEAGAEKKPSEKDDYYAAVNYERLKEHDAEKTGENWNWFYDLEDKAAKKQKEIVEEAAKMQQPANGSEAKIKTLYEQAMDQTKRDADGLKHFNALFDPVLRANSIEELIEASTKLHAEYGFDALINFEPLAQDQSPDTYSLMLSDLNYFLDRRDFEDSEFAEENQRYFESYLSRLLELSGISEKSEARQVALQVYDFLKTVAQAEPGQELEPMKLADLQKLLPEVNLDAVIKETFPNAKSLPEEILVQNPGGLKVFARYLNKDSLTMLKSYLYLVNLHQSAPYLTRELQKARFESESDEDESFDDYLKKQPFKQTADLLKWDLGHLYSERNYSPEKKKAVMDMVNKILEEYESMLAEEDWLSPATRQKAIEKLKNIDLRIGVPENIERYLLAYTLDPQKSYFENVLNIYKEGAQKSYAGYGKPVDRTVWQLLPQELNPSYYPTDNSINIPVAALEAPYFDLNASEETNLGALGTIVAHEITHAFDDLGSQYDEKGNYVNWWTDQDRKEFENRAKRIISYYDNYKTPGTMQQDGKQTLGENIADLGAMRALSRLVEKNNLDAKKFFESYANAWASTSTSLSDAIILGMDEHASDKVRVNAVLASNDLFNKIYDIQEKDGMYIRPEERAALW